MSTVQIYYEPPEDSNWLEAFYGDNESMDRRTLEIHQVKVHRVVITPNITYHPHKAFRPEQQRLPQFSRSSSLDLRTLGPMKLEHEPPIPTLRSESSIHRLYSTIRRHAPRQTFAEFLYEEGDSASPPTTATDSEYENCLLPYCGALPRPSGESSIAAAASSPSPSSATNPELQLLPVVVMQVVSSKTHKACRALKKRFLQ
ncbi:hypothetical protein N7517_000368 [Penicillium concentricum]|uniref:Uncharacterized protein n=1 Tax=Penicillium concentricum TaxID=293559 RepID=A0A9W9SQ57_9EURO|nr:uncharacterized protein N7517_000368 [Penicillium concentricum]KAJ5382457.1 hypothetical protein N7517_000368 [Penicillium concentricum]